MTSTLGIKKIQYPNGTNIATLDSSGSIAFAGASTVAGTLGVTGAITGTLATAAQTNITSVGTLTSFRSTGIDDNADAVALTIDNGENVAIGVTSKNSSNNGSLTIGHTGMTKITGSANGNADELVLIGADASANVGMSIISNNANIGGIFFGDEDDTDIGRIEYYHSDNSMRFQTNTSERMRIDTSGNLLVGKTSADISVQGAELREGGFNAFVRDTTQSGEAVLLINKKNYDGVIQFFQKDTTTVGSIGTLSGYLTIGDDVGILFNNANPSISAFNASTNANRDGAIDIGASNARFKDLYLSGGLRVGGTGTANTLDDYEEGTFTPTVSNATGYSAQFGTYKKIGHLVFINANIVVTSASGSTNTISSLPFASKNTGNSSGNLSIGYYSDINTPMVWLSGYVLNASTNIYITGNSAGHTGATIQHNGGNMFKTSGNSRIMFSVVYEAA